MEQTKDKPRADYWVNDDHVILDDVTRFGLHRKHIVRPRGWPDFTAWCKSFPQAGVQVYMDEKGYGHLWLYWKEKK